MIPFNWALILFIIAQVLKNRRIKKYLRISAFSILLLFSNTAFFQYVCSAWEEQFPIPSLNSDQPYNIVVLGGYSSMNEESQQISFNHAADRLLNALPILFLNPDNKIVLSGGSANIYFDETPESAYIINYLKSINISKDKILVEDKSRNTYENALFTTKLLQDSHLEQPIILVTSAFHMYRANACFNKQGMKVIPYPTQPLRSLTPLKPLDYFTPSLNTLNTWPTLIKEWVGIIIYKIRSYV
nr:YdcF family protein [uncultured Carboxylicivirga sp.]